MCDEKRWSTSRRGLMQWGASALGALFASQLTQSSVFADEGAKPARPKRCVLLWMNGGPSHIDTFDPKKGATGGSFKALATRTPGVSICEHLPQVADISDKLAIVRGMTSKEGNHQRAQYLVHTGYMPNPTVMHPSLGSWIAHESAVGAADLPKFVSLNGPSLGSGFLGAEHAPFVVQKSGELPEGASRPGDVGADRQARRLAALGDLEDRFAASSKSSVQTARRATYDAAVRMMGSAHLDAFDIDEEPDAVKTAYGDSDFGRGCLTARRLVEAGVPFVEVVLDGWDTHQDNFGRTQRLMGQLDPAMATLVRELDERRLLDDTLVVWMGEFGRSPEIRGDEGRNHHPAAWSAVLAGGGARRGIVRGQTDERGEKVVSGAITVPDLFATMFSLLGHDPSKTLPTPLGRPISLTDSGIVIPDLVA